jgi:hypothetical protein
MSTDRVKLAYVFNEADFRNTVCNPAVKATPAIAPLTIPPATGVSNETVKYGLSSAEWTPE